MAWHDTGTVNVTLNNANVAGVNTNWLAGARPGDAFQGPDGRLYEVLNVASNTSITLTVPYRGPTATAQKYSLVPIQGYPKRSADILASLAQDLGGVPVRLTAVENGRLVKANNLSDLTDKAASRTNLGLGSAATEELTSLLTKAGNLAGLANVATARNNLGLGSAALAAMIGVIKNGNASGQTALMDMGSNTNGVWYRFANNFIACTSPSRNLGPINTPDGNVFRSADHLWTYPIALTGDISAGGVITSGWASCWLSTGNDSVTPTRSSYRGMAVTSSGSQSVNARLFVMGWL